MSLKLSDLDDFTLSELDDFSLHELDNMSYQELVDAVKAKHRIASTVCGSTEVLSEAQQNMVREIAISCGEANQPSLAQTISVGVAINIISQFLFWCADKTVEHLPEITTALKQAYTLLVQLINQIGQ